MKALLPLAEKIATSLIARKQTIAIAESSTGGLVAAALLAVPGASAYFLGGAVVYTKSSRAALLGIGDSEMKGLRPATEDYSLLIAQLVRERHGATWGFGETGATGPSGNRYGDPAGHTCLAVAGPAERAITLRTGSADRLANMDAFAKRSLELLVDVVAARVELLGGLGHLGADNGAEGIDWCKAFRCLHVPEGPAVAGFEALRQSADAVD